MPTSIRRLPPLVVNQIAAGEVIERPASVAKELVENALDAGARAITIAIEQGGCELIRVTDDGAGIAFDEMPLALAAHATSKITSAEDLDEIGTMGFRGEALASIASVSRISLLSRPADQERAGLVEGEGDRLREPRPAAGPKGTTVRVRNLFFNTPARRRFLKTEQTEGARVAEIVRTIALAHPEIAFTLEVDGRRRLELTPSRSPRARALAVLGEELEEQLLEVDATESGIRLWGLTGRPEIARPTSRHQRVYLNGRPISDRTVTHAIKEAYRGLIEPSRSPTIVLFLEMDPATVDVNVHPAKAEVRFRDQSRVHHAVLAAVREALRAADLTPALDLALAGDVASLALPVPPPPPFSSGLGGGGGDGGAAEFVESLRRLGPKEKGFVYSEMKEALAREAPEILEREIAGAAAAPDEPLPTVRPVRDVLQVHSSYLVTEDAEGVLIIDQHALHERVMFEKLKQRVEHGALEAQRLLVPETFDVPAAQVEALEALKPLLARLGIEAELMGPTTIAVHAFTSLLFARGVETVPFMQELLARATDEGLLRDPEAALHEVLDMMSCKAAVKAGDRLAPEEIEELLEKRETVERSSNCPHGRPTTLRLSLKELARQFGRT